MPPIPQIRAVGRRHLALRHTMCDAPGPYCENKEKGPRDPHNKGDKMGSIAREIRLTQKAAAEAAVAARITKLKAAGIDEKQMAKDVYLRKAKAELRKTLSRIAAIDAREEIAKAAAERKAQAAAAPKEKVKKSAKAAAAPPKAKKEKKAK